MAITIPSYDDLEARYLANYRVRFSTRDLSTESFLGKLARAEAMAAYQLLLAITNADADAVPTSKSSSAALDAWAVAIGLSNGQGGYGRKSSTVALGLSANATGTKGTVFRDGTLLTASDGTTVFKLNNGGSPLVIPGNAPGTGSVAATFDAVTGGTIANLPVGSVLNWQTPPSGADATIVTTGLPTTLGIDTEQDPQLLQRIQAKMQAPAKGGASADFRGWAESISGVSRAYSYPLRGGLGTVHVVITGVGSGTNRRPTGTVQANVNNYVNGSSSTNTGGQRSVTAQGYSTLLPYMPSYGTGPGGIGGLTIRCRMLPAKSKYNFDWIDTATSYTVSAYTAGPPAVVTLGQALPGTLTAAVDAGLKPRIQILATGGTPSAVPIQANVIAYNSGAKTLTLDTLPGTWVAPNNGDVVYAGGPTVTQTANAILSYIDSLGPSRKSTYAEAVSDFWEDTAAIARIQQICLDQVDSDGSKFFQNIVTGATIANGSNSAASTDVQASDNTANGPELLWARFIAVTQ